MALAPLFALLGVVSLATVALLLRSLGPSYRVGRLLAATPEVSIEEALELANGGAPAYVRLTGRISSDEEFPDDQDRPLVFRRTRIQLGDRGRWRTVLDEREAVPFGVESRSALIAVDDDALADGLVVIPREAAGRAQDLAAEMADALPRDHDPQAPARLMIEQLSAVEHATVCGRPVLQAGRATLTAGTGRPLIVTTLEAPAAMRLLARGHRTRVAAAALLLFVGLGLLGAAAVALLLGV